jgi:hypothetical protein
VLLGDGDGEDDDEHGEIKGRGVPRSQIMGNR